MTQPQITPEELSAKWSIPLNEAFIRIITLEKQVAAQAALIQEMTTSQVALEVEPELKKPPPTFSRIAAEIAAEGSAIITDAKEKAAP